MDAADIAVATKQAARTKSFEDVSSDDFAVEQRKGKDKSKGKKQQKGGGSTKPQAQKGPGKLRGREQDLPEVRLSKTLSWLLRHGAKGEGLPMRADGYVQVTDLLANPKIRSQALDLAGLKKIVETDAKKRYDLLCEDTTDEGLGVWWIRANQGHSIQAVKLDLKPILSAADLPSGTAVHGTSKRAWESIKTSGLSKMKRNHIHIAQGIPGDDNVISGMRNSSQVFIYINVQRAIDAGIKFFLSENGVVLTEGNEAGFLLPEFFQRVEGSDRKVLEGWEGQIDKAAVE